MANKNPAHYYYYLALTGYFALFFLMMLWYTLLSPSQHFPISVVLLVVVAPLLFPLRGLLHGRLKATAWAAYISLLYFMHGVSEAFIDQPERLYGSLEILFSLMLFFGATFYVRFAGKG